MSDEMPEADDLESRWPTDGDRLFVETAWAYDAHVVRDPAERFYRMPMGYKRAGDVLIHQASADLVDRRNIVYAALFCYRQSIELFLKALIEAFGPGTVVSSKKTHDLSQLWATFMSILDGRAAADSMGLSAAQRLVAEMHEADQRSDCFRFPSDRDSTPFGFGDRGINLANLRDVIEGLANFFECAYLDLSHR